VGYPSVVVAGAELTEREHAELQLKVRTQDKRYELGHTIVRALSLVACAYFLYLSVLALAGKETTVLVDALMKVGVGQWLPYVIAAITGTAWFRERRLRQTVIKQQGVYIEGLETKVLPDRESSGLLPTGEPRKEYRHG